MTEAGIRAAVDAFLAAHDLSFTELTGQPRILCSATVHNESATRNRWREFVPPETLL